MGGDRRHYKPNPADSRAASEPYLLRQRIGPPAKAKLRRDGQFTGRRLSTRKFLQGPYRSRFAGSPRLRPDCEGMRMTATFGPFGKVARGFAALQGGIRVQFVLLSPKRAAMR